MEKNIEYIRGNSLKITFNIKDKNGNIINLTDNAKINFAIKQNCDIDECCVHKSLEDGIVHTSIGYVITINPDDTEKLKCGKYTYSIKVRDDNFVKTLVIGEFEITSEVIRKSNEV